MSEALHALLCPVHGIMVKVAVACPFALAATRVAICKLKERSTQCHRRKNK